jgi:hypothetical protein
MRAVISTRQQANAAGGSFTSTAAITVSANQANGGTGDVGGNGGDGAGGSPGGDGGFGGSGFGDAIFDASAAALTISPRLGAKKGSQQSRATNNITANQAVGGRAGAGGTGGEGESGEGGTPNGLAGGAGTGQSGVSGVSGTGTGGGLARLSDSNFDRKHKHLRQQSVDRG